jgi:taurine dioxygenase
MALPSGRAGERGGSKAGMSEWHADMTYIEVPPKAAILHAIEVPRTGSNTYFADMFAAYETLPELSKNVAEGRVAAHDASLNSAGMLRKGYEEVTDVREIGARHRLARLCFSAVGGTAT